MKNRKQEVRAGINWDDAPEILTTYQAAELLGCGYSAIRGLILRGDIPSRKVGIAYKIPKESLYDWIKSRGEF